MVSKESAAENGSTFAIHFLCMEQEGGRTMLVVKEDEAYPPAVLTLMIIRFGPQLHLLVLGDKQFQWS